MAQPNLKLDLAPHERQLGKYRLLAKLGEGGMGTVYLALASGFGAFRKLLVVKELRRDLPWRDTSLAMFMDEAQLAARLDHPNVLQTFEAGEADGRHFLAMEYLDGQPLSIVLDRAHRTRGLPLEIWVHVLCEVLSGLSYAHELTDFDGAPLNVVHRDVSPQNVFITYHGQVKIVDFGVAKANNSSSLTSPGMFKGKFAYAAPEQLLGRPVDARCDVFAVGVMLWEVMSGRRFSESTPSAPAFRTRASGAEPRIRELVPHADPLLAELCDHALEVEPDDRFESAQAFRLELEDWLASHGGHVQPAQIGLHMRELFSEDRKLRHQVIEEAMLEAGATLSVMQQLPPVEPPDVSTSGPARQRTESSTSVRAHSGTPSSVQRQPPPPSGHHVRAPSVPPPLPPHRDPHTPSVGTRSAPASQPMAAFGKTLTPSAGARVSVQPTTGDSQQTPVLDETPELSTSAAASFGQTGTQPPVTRVPAEWRAAAATLADSARDERKDKAAKPARSPKPPWTSAAVLFGLAIAVFATTYQLSSRVATHRDRAAISGNTGSPHEPAAPAPSPEQRPAELGAPEDQRGEPTLAASAEPGVAATETSVHAAKEAELRASDDRALGTPGQGREPGTQRGTRSAQPEAREIQPPSAASEVAPARAAPALTTKTASTTTHAAKPDPAAPLATKPEGTAEVRMAGGVSSSPAARAASSVGGRADQALAQGAPSAAKSSAKPQPAAPLADKGAPAADGARADSLQPAAAKPEPAAAKGRAPVLRVRSDPALGSDLRELRRSRSLRIDVEDPYQ